MRSSEWRWPTFSSNALLSLRRAHSRCLPVRRSEFIRSVRPQVQPVSKPVQICAIKRSADLTSSTVASCIMRRQSAACGRYEPRRQAAADSLQTLLSPHSSFHVARERPISSGKMMRILLRG